MPYLHGRKKAFVFVVLMRCEHEIRPQNIDWVEYFSGSGLIVRWRGDPPPPPLLLLLLPLLLFYNYSI